MAWLSRQKGTARNNENVQEGSREAQRKAGWWGSGDPGVPDVSWWVSVVGLKSVWLQGWSFWKALGEKPILAPSVSPRPVTSVLRSPFP